MRDRFPATVGPAIDPGAKKTRTTGELDLAFFPKEERAFGIEGGEPFYEIDAPERGARQFDKFPDHLAVAFDQAGVVPQIKQISPCGRPAERGCSPQPGSVGLVAAQSAIHEQVAGRDIGRKFVVVHERRK